MTTLIRRLGPDDAAAFQALRLQGLLECPTAFASSHEEEAGEPVSAVAARLGGEGVFGVYGAFAPSGALLGVAGLGREPMVKMAHKATLWGMYVAPEARRQGVAGALVAHLLAQAAGEPRLRQVMLGVHARNEPALALYRSLGFVAWGTEPAAGWVDGEAQDETWMVCPLPGRSRATASRPAMAVMMHCADPDAARAWYQRLWPAAQSVHLSEPQAFDLLLLDGVQLEFVPADAKAASGKAGSVVYWPVDDFDAMRAHAQALGATLYRGPMAIEQGRRMAQFVDPFGNLFGLRGR
jgi:ribosomal protein S18 acetylase RimI-like enzyme